MALAQFHKLPPPKKSRSWTHNPFFLAIFSFLLSVIIGTQVTLTCQARQQARKDEETAKRELVKEANTLMSAFQTSSRKVLRTAEVTNSASRGKWEAVLMEWSAFADQWDVNSERIREDLHEEFPDTTAMAPSPLFDSICEASSPIQQAVNEVLLQLPAEPEATVRLPVKECKDRRGGGGIEGNWCEAVERWKTLPELFETWKDSADSVLEAEFS